MPFHLWQMEWEGNDFHRYGNGLLYGNYTVSVGDYVFGMLKYLKNLYKEEQAIREEALDEFLTKE